MDQSQNNWQNEALYGPDYFSAPFMPNFQLPLPTGMEPWNGPLPDFATHFAGQAGSNFIGLEHQQNPNHDLQLRLAEQEAQLALIEARVARLEIENRKL